MERGLPRGAILFLSWEPAKTAAVREQLLALVKSCKEISWTLLQIDNAHEDLPWHKIDDKICDAYCVGGDNTQAEFSGWDKGWNVLRDELREPFDVVIIATDALMNSKPCEQLHEIDDTLLRYMTKWKGVLGWVDTYCDVSTEPLNLISHPMEIFGHTSRSWISTAFVVFSAPVFERVFPLARFNDVEKVYFDSYRGEAFREECGLSPQYQTFLLEHQSRIWSKKYVLSDETYGLFKAKTRMIINEHLLACRINGTPSRIIGLKTLARLSGKRQRLSQRLMPFDYLRFRYLSALTRRDITYLLKQGSKTPREVETPSGIQS